MKGGGGGRGGGVKTKQKKGCRCFLGNGLCCVCVCRISRVRVEYSAVRVTKKKKKEKRQKTKNHVIRFNPALPACLLFCFCFWGEGVLLSVECPHIRILLVCLIHICLVKVRRERLRRMSVRMRMSMRPWRRRCHPTIRRLSHPHNIPRLRIRMRSIRRHTLRHRHNRRQPSSSSITRTTNIRPRRTSSRHIRRPHSERIKRIRSRRIRYRRTSRRRPIIRRPTPPIIRSRPNSTTTSTIIRFNLQLRWSRMRILSSHLQRSHHRRQPLVTRRVSRRQSRHPNKTTLTL